MKTKWKEFQFDTSSALHELEACQGELPELKKYVVDIQIGASVLETNASWGILRSWFRISGVRMPYARITEERYVESSQSR